MNDILAITIRMNHVFRKIVAPLSTNERADQDGRYPAVISFAAPRVVEDSCE
jgi:hypothetical protein